MLREFAFDVRKFTKKINNLHTSLMKQIFELRGTSTSFREKYRLNLNIPCYNLVTFGEEFENIWTQNLKQFTLPHYIEFSKNLESFKTVAKNWDDVTCKCVICKKF